MLGGRVGVLTSRTLDTYAGILGACWSGASYVPINVKLPAARLANVVARGKLEALVVDETGANRLEQLESDLLPQRIFGPITTGRKKGGNGGLMLQGLNPVPEPVTVSADHCAYVMFTSGTTGLPKVGLIGHIIPAPLTLVPTSMERWGYKYTRVEMGNGSMIDHIAHLKNQLGIPRNKSFSVWEMSLASVLLLRSRLKESGNEVLTINYIDSDNEEQEFARIKEFAPEILALSTTFILSPSQLNYVARLIRKHLPDTFVVAGGQHISTELANLNDKQQRAYLKATRLDGFINDAQGEASLVKLTRLHPARLAEVPNLLWRQPSGEIVINPRQAEANDLNATINLSGIREGSVVHLRTARGCAFHCSFCSYPASGGTWSLANVESAIAQLRLAKEAGAGAVIFTDDTFNVPKERFDHLLDRMIEAGINLPWYSFLRCQFVDAALVEKMRRSGCRGVLLGIESGADSVLSNMNKGAKVEHYRRGIQWLKNAGITSVGSFLIGFPGETAETVSQTEEFISNAGLDFFYLQLFYYLHHAPVHQVASKFGLTGGGLLWSHTTMDWQEASVRLDQIFRKLGSRCLHQDYNLWEVAFLENRGFDRDRIAQYRAMINRMALARLDSAPDPSGNHKHACAIHFFHYNFCRIHQTLRVTPAMQAGIVDRVWEIEDMVKLCDSK